MIKNYLKIAWRNLTRNRVYSFINISGLALGMAVVLLIGSWMRGELTYNKVNPLHDRVAAVMQHSTHGSNIQTWWSMPIPLGDYLRKQYASDFEKVALSSGGGGHILKLEGGQPLNSNGMYAEPALPEIFSLKMIAGSRSLDDPSSFLISRSLAKALFGDQPALNRSVKLDDKDVLKVTGVYEDLPSDVDFKETQFFCSWEFFIRSQSWVASNLTEWNANSFILFALMKPGVSMEQTSRKIAGALEGHDRKDHPKVFLHPMNNWHLYDEFKGGVNTGGAIRYVWLFGFIGVFILLLACINFMNLATARSERRAKEVGIRKAVGSLKGQLVSQFLGESIFMTALAMFLAVLLASVSLPWFSQLAGRDVVMPWSPAFVGAIVATTILVGLMAGSYPALYLSSFNAVKVLKGTLKAG
ncbi:MAG: ABC transporter permease, partial [Bacteroidetes bacterium]|nr:ABC transporter permease [Bacteroidota bacterium]